MDVGDADDEGDMVVERVDEGSRRGAIVFASALMRAYSALENRLLQLAREAKSQTLTQSCRLKGPLNLARTESHI